MSDVLDLSAVRGVPIDPMIVSGKICPFRSAAIPVPQPGGRIGFAEYVAACRRDCMLFLPGDGSAAERCGAQAKVGP